MAASSSPIYGGGPRWGTNDLALQRIEVGDKRLPLRAVPPSRPSPATRGKETLPHAGTERAYCSVFLPHLWGRIEVGDKRPPLRAVPHPGLPPQRGGRRRCHMRVQSGHFAASSSPIYGGGLRWGIDDFLCALSPIPVFPRDAGEGDAATCSLITNIWQHLPPPFMGEDRGGGQTTSHLKRLGPASLLRISHPIAAIKANPGFALIHHHHRIIIFRDHRRLRQIVGQG